MTFHHLKQNSGKVPQMQYTPHSPHPTFDGVGCVSVVLLDCQQVNLSTWTLSPYPRTPSLILRLYQIWLTTITHECLPSMNLIVKKVIHIRYHYKWISDSFCDSLSIGLCWAAVAFWHILWPSDQQWSEGQSHCTNQDSDRYRHHTTKTNFHWHRHPSPQSPSTNHCWYRFKNCPVLNPVSYRNSSWTNA